MTEFTGRGVHPDAKLPVDDKVKLPPSVVAQAAAAEAAHAAAYAKPTDAPQPAPAPAPAAADQGSQPTTSTPAPAAPAPQAAPSPAPAPQAAPSPARAAVPETGEPGSWEHRFYAMKGRYDQAQATIGGLQEQMGELGDELMRTQVQVRSIQTERNPNDPTALPGQRPVGQAPRKLVTDQDVNTYGQELIDFVKRAATEAVAPEINQTRQQVRQVSQRVGQVTQGDMMAALDRDVPNWKTINVDPRFKQWCRLPDVYSGQVRGALLNAAFQAADAPRVVAFFNGFLAEEQATGQLPAPQPQPGQPQVQDPPRQAAVALESLTAPGRPKPAGGDSPAGAADKPVFTRAQIASFYTAVRRGEYAGREQEKANFEASIFAAQKDGRVRG